MNEEEIMDIIKGKLLMTKRMLEEDDNDGHASAYEMQSEDFEAIQGLLDLYNKEKEENTFLEKQNEFLSKQYEEMFDDLNNVVSKDKIKAKIEEVEQWELYNMKIPRLSTLDERLGAKIGIKYVLQSLLEKE